MDDLAKGIAAFVFVLGLMIGLFCVEVFLFQWFLGLFGVALTFLQVAGILLVLDLLFAGLRR